MMKKKITLFNQLIDLGLSPTDIQINKDDSKNNPAHISWRNSIL